jgi:WD40 repeat protein
VAAVAVGEVDGTPVAVTGGEDRAVRVWDLRTGTARGGPLRGHTGRVAAVAVGEADGTPVAVTGGEDRAVRVWDLRTGMARGEPLIGHNDRVEAVAVGEVHGILVAASGDNHGTILLWALDSGRRLPVRLGAPAGINAIASDGRGGWLTATKDGSLFFWALATDTMALGTGANGGQT